jgi:hypothetical protein
MAVVTFPLAAWGAWRGRRQLLCQLCLLWVGGLWLFHALIHAELRYNFPVLPMLFLLAVLGLRFTLEGPRLEHSEMPTNPAAT